MRGRFQARYPPRQLLRTVAWDLYYLDQESVLVELNAHSPHPANAKHWPIFSRIRVENPRRLAHLPCEKEKPMSDNAYHYDLIARALSYIDALLP